jgi:RNA polymerase sigma-70 factor (ECF subfamily)
MKDVDRSLLRGIEQGDRAALDALAQHYAAPVYRYLVRLCGDATLAEDLAQETAVQMWRGLSGRRFPNTRALNSWVYTVATNAFRMHHRRKRAGEVPLEDELCLVADDASDPALSAEREDFARRVRRAVELLPEPERQALLMKVFGDLRYQEISQATGEPVGTVKWRISRAYARLRQLLHPELHPAEDGNEALRPTPVIPGRRDDGGGALAYAASPAALPGLYGAD